ncbi:tRNA-dependent cyclodipeptide synthase [Nocardia sp. NPDC056000]|uniref:tRNA-dependent cyclodipeptide synthase n=1 Tax=Nocardia sp. NPDC056000 TaxID=3345674 RepID=UPI0035E3BD10
MPMALELAAQPLTANCARLFADRDHLLLGISPFNSYFTRDRIAELTRWAAKEFRHIQFHLPDTPSIFTLLALGFPEDKARKRAHENGLKMRNRIRDAITLAGLPDADSRIVNWAYVDTDPAFLALHREVLALFDIDSTFREQCLETSRNVLRHRLPAGTEPEIEQCVIAARYFLAELPLFLDTPGIVGSESSLYAYHRRTPFLDALFRHDLPIRPSARQGYLTLSPSPETIADDGHDRLHHGDIARHGARQ